MARSTAAAGDHRLLRRVVVGGSDDAALLLPGGLGACLLHQRRLEAENGGHRALAGRHCLLHEGAARADGAHCIGKAQGARRDQRRVLAQRMAGMEGGELERPARLAHQRAVGRDADGEDGRLRVGGLAQLFFGAVGHHAQQAALERRVGLVERRAGLGVLAGERLAHADVLRALSGKDERELHRILTSARARCPTPCRRRWPSSGSDRRP